MPFAADGRFAHSSSEQRRKTESFVESGSWAPRCWLFCCCNPFRRHCCQKLMWRNARQAMLAVQKFSRRGFKSGGDSWASTLLLALVVWLYSFALNYNSRDFSSVHVIVCSCCQSSWSARYLASLTVNVLWSLSFFLLVAEYGRATETMNRCRKPTVLLLQLFKEVSQRREPKESLLVNAQGLGEIIKIDFRKHWTKQSTTPYPLLTEKRWYRR